jgi:hypothetical protein
MGVTASNQAPSAKIPADQFNTNAHALAQKHEVENIANILRQVQEINQKAKDGIAQLKRGKSEVEAQQKALEQELSKRRVTRR